MTTSEIPDALSAQKKKKAKKSIEKHNEIVDTPIEDENIVESNVSSTKKKKKKRKLFEIAVEEIPEENDDSTQQKITKNVTIETEAGASAEKKKKKKKFSKTDDAVEDNADVLMEENEHEHASDEKKKKKKRKHAEMETTNEPELAKEKSGISLKTKKKKAKRKEKVDITLLSEEDRVRILDEAESFVQQCCENNKLEPIESLITLVKEGIEQNSEKMCLYLQALQRCLTHVRTPLKITMTQKDVRGKGDDMEREEKIITLIKMYRNHIDMMLSHKNNDIQLVTLRLLLQCCQEESEILGQFPTQLFREIISIPLNYRWNQDVLTLFVEEWANYSDVRYGLFSFIEQEAKKDPSSKIYQRLFNLLRALPRPSPRGEKVFEEDAGECLASKQLNPKALQKIFEQAWIELLSVTPKDDLKQTLNVIPTDVFPWLQNPLLLADCYLRAFQDERLDVNVVALSGLFYLLTRTRLADTQVSNDYGDQFYTKLYSMLTPDLMKLESGRFRRLFAMALNSTMLPASFIGSFAKRALAVALQVTEVQPTLWLIAVAHNLMQKKASVCRPLLSREKDEPARVDPFTLDLTLPEAAAVIGESSAWELMTLKSHWCPPVNRLASLFDTPKMFDVGAHIVDPDAFLDDEWSDRWKQELKHKRRKLEKGIEPSFSFEPLMCSMVEPIYQLAFNLEEDTYPCKD